MANRNPNHPWRKQSRFFSTKPAKSKTQEGDSAETLDEHNKGLAEKGASRSARFNPVAKHARQFNKASVYQDRKKAFKRGEQKHKSFYEEQKP